MTATTRTTRMRRKNSSNPSNNASTTNNANSRAATSNNDSNDETSNSNNNANNSSTTNTNSNKQRKGPKKINSNSTNRRKKKNSESNRSSTPEANNRSVPTFQNKTRATIKFTLPPSPNRLNLLVNQLKALLQELHSADDVAEILPWFSFEALKYNLKTGLRVPNDIIGLRTYLNGCYIPTKDEDETVTIWAKIYIGHNLGFPDLEKALGAWCSNGNHRIFRNMVQAEKVIEKGWFLWSTRAMDAGALADEMSEQFEFEVGIRWKTIYTGKGRTREEDKVFALALDLEAKQSKAQVKKIVQFYNKRNRAPEEYPNGIRLRFVKSIDDCINRRDQAKVLQLKSKQKSYLQAVRTTTSYEIEQIDYAGDIPEGNENEFYTLRQMIMSLKTDEDETVPLFISVDLDWKKEGHTFQYAPNFADQAERTILTLIPLLDYKFPDQNIRPFFTPEAHDRCLGMKVNEETGLVEEEGDELYDIDADDDMYGFEFDITPEAAAGLMRPRATMPHEDDGVSTIRTHSSNKKRRMKTSNTGLINLENDSNSGNSNGNRSSASTITAQTVRTMETQIVNMQMEIASTKGFMQEIRDLLKSQSSATGTSHTLAEISEAGTEETQAGSRL